MKKFILGFITGIFLAAGIYFFLHQNRLLQIELGRLLDKDTIYLENGTIVKGWIVRESEREILVEVEKGYFTVPRSRCKEIRENALLRYTRELM